MEVATFTCSICDEESHDICVACTKDACANHLCERCLRCSDCCVCEVRLVTHYHQNGKVEIPELPVEAEATAVALEPEEFENAAN